MKTYQLSREKNAKKFRFIVYMDMTISADVSAKNLEEAVEIIEGMDAEDLMKHKIIDISTVDFESDF